METREQLIKWRESMKLSMKLEEVIDDVERRIRNFQENVLRSEDIPGWAWESDLDTWTDKEIDEAIEEQKEHQKFEDIINNG